MNRTATKATGEMTATNTTRKKRPGVISVITALLLTLSLALTSCLPPQPEPQPLPEPGTLEVTFIDVGQGDAALLASEGHFMLIDGGNVSDSSKMYSILNQQGIDELDVVIFSHTDADHVGGLSGALNAAKVGICYGPEETRAKATDAFTNFKKALADQGLSITIPKDGQSFVFGSATVTMWHIVKLNKDGSPTGDPNDNELVVRVVNGTDSFLFTGDINKDMEKLLVESGADIESTVLKVPHHGSASSSSYLFLREVMPRYAVISVGAKNTYGHPTDEALSMYRDLNKSGSLEALYWTWYHGDITFISTPDGLTVETQKTTANDVFATPR